MAVSRRSKMQISFVLIIEKQTCMNIQELSGEALSYLSITNRIDGTVSSFNYTVEEASANQKDLLVAKMSDTYTHSKGKL